MIDCNIQLDPGASIPTRAHDTDTGYDIRALTFDYDPGLNKIFIDTGVHIQPPPGYYFELVPNSRLAKTPFSYGNSIGVIDQGYTGSIKVVLNVAPQATSMHFDALQKGSVVGQLILRKRLDANFHVVTSLSQTDRGAGGFGSTENKENNE